MGLACDIPVGVESVEFEVQPFDHGTFRDAYKGQVNKEEFDNTATWANYVGWSSEVNHCVVKRFRSGPVMCVADWESDLRALTKAAELAETFNRKLKPDTGISFATPFICELKSLGITWQHTHGPFGQYHGTMRISEFGIEGERILVEPYLSGRFEKVNSNSGWWDIFVHLTAIMWPRRSRTGHGIILTADCWFVISKARKKMAAGCLLILPSIRCARMDIHLLVRLSLQLRKMTKKNLRGILCPISLLACGEAATGAGQIPQAIFDLEKRILERDGIAMIFKNHRCNDTCKHFKQPTKMCDVGHEPHLTVLNSSMLQSLLMIRSGGHPTPMQWQLLCALQSLALLGGAWRDMQLW